MIVSSRQHPIVDAFRELAATPDPAGRRLLLDGVHLVRDAQAAGLEFELAAIAQSALEAGTEERTTAEALQRDGVEVIAVSDAVLRAISPVQTPSGLVAVVRRAAASLRDICAQASPFIVVAIDVQDPGNLGSLMRVAEAGGATGMIVAGGSAHPFGWKAIRGSMGSALRLPVAAASVDVALRALRTSGISVVASVPRGGSAPENVLWSGPVALLLGGEGPGLPADVIAAADERVSIPMLDGVESLNVAAAGAVLVYAARRLHAASGSQSSIGS